MDQLWYKGLFFKSVNILAIFSTGLLLIQTNTDTPPVRAHHSMVYNDKDGSVMLYGGSTPLDGGQRFDFYNDTWKYDDAGWTRLGESGNKRSGVALVFQSKVKLIYSFGGYSGDSSLSDLRKYENGKWQHVSFLNGFPSAEPGLVYDEDRDRLIVFGGSAGRGSVNDVTWEWDGNSWKKFQGDGPGGRQAFAMVYDTRRKKTILFGGMGTNPGEIFSDTWEYDGQYWRKLDLHGPSARMSMGFTYDESNGLFLIFGGASAAGFQKDTWGFDGKSWSLLSESGPSSRVMGYMAYDKKRKRTILFGGRVGWPHDVNDTWEWNGNEWTEKK